MPDRSTRAWLTVCAFALGAVAGAADHECEVVNLMPPFWAAIDEPDAAARLRVGVIDPHPDLYNENYVALPLGERWENEVSRERTYVSAHRAAIESVEAYLSGNVPRFMRDFGRQFPDYRCDYTFYIAPSFGRMDGSAAYVNGQHRIIFAPDVIPRYHALADLKVLIDHETFHIYHHQVTRVFGASAEAVPTVMEALWGEGLATFVSRRMNPGASLDTALLQPGIPAGSEPHLAAIAADLLAHLDAKDEGTYLRYFVANKQPPGYPPRAGYYVGMLIAERLSTRYSLKELAHLNGRPLHSAVVAELKRLERGS